MKERETMGLAQTIRTSLVKILLSFVLLFTVLIPEGTANAAGYLDGTMKEEPITYSGLRAAKFTTPTGSATVPGFLSRINSKHYSTLGFTYTNPTRVSEQASVTMQSLPESSSEELLTAILSFRELFSLDKIRKDFGVNATQNQLDEATQFALWLNAAKVQVSYQVDANSITDTTVKTLATEISSWASQQVTSAGSDAKMGDYLFPVYEPSLNTTRAKTVKKGNSVVYGPYTITAQKGSKFNYGVMGGVLLDSSNKKLKAVKAGQQFYAKFPEKYTGSKQIRVKGLLHKYTLSYGKNRLWLDKEPSETEVSFSVGMTTGTSGAIQLNVTDSRTGKPIQDVGMDIKTTTSIGNEITDESGSAKFGAPVGKYMISFTVPEEYIKPKSKAIEIKFAGDVKVINLKLDMSVAIMNFHTVDSESLKPAADSEAFIYNSEGKAIKRIAITKGKVSGITLPAGDYNLVQYKSTGGFALNVGTDFKAVTGKVSSISIPQDPKAFQTTINIDGASVNDAWVYTLTQKGKVLFKMNGKNSLTLPLPSGEYQISARKSDGTVSAAPIRFSTNLNGDTKVSLSMEKGTETIVFNVKDAKVGKPIPTVTLGLFDEDHNLLQYKTGDTNGKVEFDNVLKYGIYYVNVIAAPSDVSGYSANGNRFLGQSKTYDLKYYSEAEMKKVTQVDTIYRLPNLVYTGTDYKYPQ